MLFFESFQSSWGNSQTWNQQETDKQKIIKFVQIKEYHRTFQREDHSHWTISIRIWFNICFTSIQLMLMGRHDVLLVHEKQAANAIFSGPRESGWGNFNPVSKCFYHQRQGLCNLPQKTLLVFYHCESWELFRAQLKSLFSRTRKKLFTANL